MPSPSARGRVKITPGPVRVGLVAALGALAIAGCTIHQPGHPQRRGAAQKTRMTTTASGLVIASRIDPGRGLIFEIQSGGYIPGTDLYVRLTADAPESTRRAMLTKPLAATCDVPGEHVREFAGFWNHRFRQFGTALMTDGPDVNVAALATACALFVGSSGADPGTATFPDQPYSRVRLR